MEDVVTPASPAVGVLVCVLLLGAQPREQHHHLSGRRHHPLHGLAAVETGVPEAVHDRRAAAPECGEDVRSRHSVVLIFN